MAYVPTLKTQYKEQIVAALMKEFGYSSVMQCPKLTKIVINQGMGQAVADKKLIDVAEAELTQITGQKAVQTRSRKDISNFKLRKGMPIGVRVTLRDTKMYEFLERLIAVALPRIRDFKGINEKFDGQGNYRHHRADHLPGDRHRQDHQDLRYGDYVRYHGQDRRGGVCPAPRIRPPFQKR